MIRRESELTIIARNEKWNGKIVRILEDGELQRKCRLFVKIIVHPGSEVPLHCHNGDVEAYYILKGIAKENDNGDSKEIYAGDVVFTKKGASHSIKNIGFDDLEFIALIIYYKNDL